MNRVTPGRRTVRRAMSYRASHAASASSPIPPSRHPASGSQVAATTPAPNKPAAMRNDARLAGVSMPILASSRRSPATVRIRNAASAGTASATGRPVWSSMAARVQPTAPAAWTHVWSPRSISRNVRYIAR